MPFIPGTKPSFFNAVVSLFIINFSFNGLVGLGFFDDVVVSCKFVPGVFYVYIIISSICTFLMWLMINTDAVNATTVQIKNGIDKFVSIGFIIYAFLMKDYYGMCGDELRILWVYAILFYNYKAHF